MHREEYTDSDYHLSAKWEGRVEDIAVRYYGFKVIKRGKGARVSHKFKEFGERETGFDLLFELPKGSRIWIEVTGDQQHTWEDSSFFPIQPLKVKRAENLPEDTYIVYYLDKDESCFWLPIKRCGQFTVKKIKTKKGLQIKHLVPKEEWHTIKGRNNWDRSLQGLYEYLAKASNSKVSSSIPPLTSEEALKRSKEPIQISKSCPNCGGTNIVKTGLYVQCQSGYGVERSCGYLWDPKQTLQADSIKINAFFKGTP